MAKLVSKKNSIQPLKTLAEDENAPFFRASHAQLKPLNISRLDSDIADQQTENDESLLYLSPVPENSPLYASKKHSSMQDFSIWISRGSPAALSDESCQKQEIIQSQKQEKETDEKLQQIRKTPKLKAVVGTIIAAKRLAVSENSTDHRIEWSEDRHRSGSKMISSASVDALCDLLTQQGNIDLDYCHHFLSTYRYFLTSSELFQRLRFLFVGINVSDPNSTLLRRSRVLNTVRMWITRHPDDFVEDQQLEENVIAFVNAHVTPIEELKRIGQSITELIQANHHLQESKKQNGLANIFVSQYAKVGIAETSTKSADSVLEFKAEKFAQQLTIIEMEFFRRIYQSEFVMQRWTKDPKLAQNLVNMIDWFNHVSYWIATEVCVEPQIKQRVAKIKFFLEVGRYCLAYRNFSSVFQIISGLLLSPVSRLKHTWAALPKKSAQIWKDLNKVVQPQENFSIYRQTLKNSGFPLIPYIGVHLADLTFAEDGSKSVLQNNRINFFKFHLIGGILNEIRLYQQVEYSLLKEDPKIFSWLMNNMSSMKIDKLTHISRRFEPPSEV